MLVQKFVVYLEEKKSLGLGGPQPKEIFDFLAHKMQRLSRLAALCHLVPNGSQIADELVTPI